MARPLLLLVPDVPPFCSSAFSYPDAVAPPFPSLFPHLNPLLFPRKAGKSCLPNFQGAVLTGFPRTHLLPPFPVGKDFPQLIQTTPFSLAREALLSQNGTGPPPSRLKFNIKIISLLPFPRGYFFSPPAYAERATSLFSTLTLLPFFILTETSNSPRQAGPL